MLAVVLFVQMLGAFLAGTFEFGLSHNYSMLRFAAFVAMALLQAVFAGLLTGALLDRLGRRPQPAAPVLPPAARLSSEERRVGKVGQLGSIPLDAGTIQQTQNNYTIKIHTK